MRPTINHFSSNCVQHFSGDFDSQCSQKTLKCYFSFHYFKWNTSTTVQSCCLLHVNHFSPLLLFYTNSLAGSVRYFIFSCFPLLYHLSELLSYSSLHVHQLYAILPVTVYFPFSDTYFSDLFFPLSHNFYLIHFKKCILSSRTTSTAPSDCPQGRMQESSWVALHKN